MVAQTCMQMCGMCGGGGGFGAGGGYGAMPGYGAGGIPGYGAQNGMMPGYGYGKWLKRMRTFIAKNIKHYLNEPIISIIKCIWHI